MGETIQHCLASGQPGHCSAVILLIQEEAGFLPVFHIYQIFHAVFRDLRDGRSRGLFSGEMIPSLSLGQALLFPQSHVVAQKYAPDGLPVFPQDTDQRGQQKILDVFHSYGENLHT